MPKDKRYRSFLKGISWRIVGTIDTMIISYFYTRNPLSALQIGMTEVLTKIVLYYVHERIYFKTFGDKVGQRKISLVKGVTWRFVGSIDTILISWIYTGDPLIGLKIGATEFLTKVVLYYIHERIWNKIKLWTIEE
ncbi:MAG: DUF2061 domain-containing protein [Chitinophagales bacterium]|jgi:uncharacterized membrane protein|nr:DUF2061 domain-containing protein [Sphingobacteriales bacterium]